MKVKVADEVWVATALLHREQPDRQSFSAGEIVDRVRKERLTETLRPGVQVHVYLHCVANKRPNPGNHRMLFATVDGNRRLFRNGDDYHDYREGGKTHPKPEELPQVYQHLIDWYLTQYYNGLMEILADMAARIEQKREQEVAEFRSSYHELDPEDRELSRKWLEKIVAAGHAPATLRARPLVEVARAFQTSDGETIHEGTVQLTPGIMLRAIKAWDEGATYTPGVLAY